MTIWDVGRYEIVKAPDPASAMSDGELKLRLFGKKLRGEWHLVRLKDGERNWLLFKSKDHYAGKARDSVLGVDLSPANEGALPDELSPMLPGEKSGPFTDPKWFFELEFEGRRVLLEKRLDRVRWRGVDASLPKLDAAVRTLRADNA